MMRWLGVVPAVILLAGCGGDPEPPAGDWKGKGCSSNGAVTVCQVVKADGKTCESTLTQDADGYYETSTTCSDTSEMDCVDEGPDVNTSGNICRVPVGDGKYCVAVLPDGGKAPKDYKDFATCPDTKEES